MDLDEPVEESECNESVELTDSNECAQVVELSETGGSYPQTRKSVKTNQNKF